MSQQETHRIAISDAASTLYPRTSSVNPPTLLSRYTPENPSGPRSAATRAVKSVSHADWFAFGRQPQRKRGHETQKRVLDVLRDAGQLMEPGNLDDLAKPLRDGQLQARRTGKPVFISTGLVRPPNLQRDYLKKGWASPGIQWANFRPALLRIDHLEAMGKKNQFRLQVVGIKSTHPNAVPAEPPLYDSEKIQLLVHRFFLVRLLAQLQRQQGNEFLRRLSISRTSAMWRYTGCHAHGCTEHDCFLNIDSRDPNWLIAQLNVIPVEDNPTLVDTFLFSQVPAALGARRSAAAGGEVITTGFAQVEVDERPIRVYDSPPPPYEAHVYSAWAL